MNMVLSIDGMSCEHCVKAVTDILSEMEGISNLEVKINSAKFDADDTVTQDKIMKAIEDAGFEFIGLAMS